MTEQGIQHMLEMSEAYLSAEFAFETLLFIRANPVDLTKQILQGIVND